MNKYLVPLLAFLFVMQVAVAQKKFKYGKPPKELLEQKEHPLEKDAKAAIIYKKEEYKYDYDASKGWLLFKEVVQRIKIYNKEGLDWATFEIPLFKNSKEEERTMSIKGTTFNLEGGKVVSAKLKGDGIFKESINKSWKSSKVTLPNVKEGSVIDFKYKVESPFIGNIDKLVFQYEIPLDYMEADLMVPEYYHFKNYQKGYYPVKINQIEGNEKTITIRYKNDVPDAGYRDGNRIKTEYESDVSFNQTKYDIKVDNVPSLKEEKYTNNIDNYRTSINFELASVRYPGQAYQNLSQTWGNVTKSIYKIKSFGGELNKKEYYENDINPLLTGVNDKLKKAAVLFNHVKSKMTWNGNYGYTTDVGVKKAYKEGVGNIAEINLMLVSMLRNAGVNANPVLVSTKKHGIPLYPTREGFNYVIAAIEVENGIILLDASDKFSYPNVLPQRVLNWKGRLVRKDGSSNEINLIPSTKSNELYTVNATLQEDGTAEGKMRMQCNNQLALYFRKNIAGMERESYLEKLENKYDEIEISEYDIKNERDLSKPIVETISFIKEDVVENIGGKLYLSPMLFFQKTENAFKSETRKYPVDFGYPLLQKYVFNFKIPEGYKIESMPQGANLKLPDNLGEFKYLIMNKGGSLQLIATNTINNAVISPTYYEYLREYYSQMITKESEKVILTKI